MRIGYELEGGDAVLAALERSGRLLGKRTEPYLRQVAEDVAAKATARATLHPSGLWRSKGRVYAPKYDVKRKGKYYWKVQTPSGISGRAEAISEFARLAATSRGLVLVRTLDSVYGGTAGGRILWNTLDANGAAYVAGLARAVEAAEHDIGKEV